MQPTQQPLAPPQDMASQFAPPTAQNVSVEEIYATICSQIIKDQGQIIGPLSLEQATQVPGLEINPATYECKITGDGKEVLTALVEKYREFFGNAAVEVCREAASRLMTTLPSEQIPEMLKG